MKLNKLFESVLKESSVDSYNDYTKNVDKTNSQKNFLDKKLSEKELKGTSGPVTIVYKAGKQGASRDGEVWSRNKRDNEVAEGDLSIYVDGELLWNSPENRIPYDKFDMLTKGLSLKDLYNFMTSGESHEGLDFEAIKHFTTVVQKFGFEEVSKDLELAFKDIIPQFKKYYAHKKNIFDAEFNRTRSLTNEYIDYTYEAEKEMMPEGFEFKKGDKVEFLAPVHVPRGFTHYGFGEYWYEGIVNSVTTDKEGKVWVNIIAEGGLRRRVPIQNVRIPGVLDKKHRDDLYPDRVHRYHYKR